MSKGTNDDTERHSQPAPGQIWSSSLMSVLFQILRIWCRSSSLASSMFPSVLIYREVRTRANRVALKFTLPSEFNGMFIDTSRCGGKGWSLESFGATNLSLSAGRCRRWRRVKCVSRCSERWSSVLRWPRLWAPPSWCAERCGWRRRAWPWSWRYRPASMACSWPPDANVRGVRETEVTG